MRPSASLCALAAAAAVPASLALNIEFTRVSTGSRSPYSFATSDKSTDEGDSFDYENSQNISGSDIYVATLTVAGKDYVVQLDTGSSDLWLDTSGADLSTLTDTGIKTGLTYGDGTSAQGDVLVGNVKFGDFTVSQAFISAPGSNATTNQDTGLLGVGPPLLSAVEDALTDSKFNGNTFIENILADNSSISQFITFSLSRSFDTGTTDGGVFSIGEIDSNFTTVTNSPKLEVIESDRWVVFMDGIIVNGKNFTGGSSFDAQGQGDGQTLANLDTGTSLSQIPQSYADAIYGSVPGSKFFSSEGIYTVPCSAEISLSFIFGGVEYPIHPIDTVTASSDGAGGVICFSGFPVGTGSTEDFLLGDSFLRNVYTVFDYGSFFNETTTSYIQLLSTTDATSAASEFQSLSSSRNSSIEDDSSSGGSSGGSSSGSLPTHPSKRWTVSALGASAVFAGLLTLL